MISWDLSPKRVSLLAVSLARKALLLLSCLLAAVDQNHPWLGEWSHEDLDNGRAQLPTSLLEKGP